MPPSGYDMTQADAIATFLESCSRALRKESGERGETIRESLQREIGGIRRYIDCEQPSPVKVAVLQLTEEFYRFTLERLDKQTNFEIAVEHALAEVTGQIRQIHVAELAF